MLPALGAWSFCVCPNTLAPQPRRLPGYALPGASVRRSGLPHFGAYWWCGAAPLPPIAVPSPVALAP
eukprot:169262-Lingulodinium_polyedra.AAC.1